MAILSITEFKKQGSDRSGNIAPVALAEGHVNNNVTTSGTSAQSSTFQSETNLIRVCTDTASHIEIGLNPTASTSTMYLPAGAVEHFAVPEGLNYKIAGITA